MKTILLDCDGVILDHVTVFHELHEHLIVHENRPTQYKNFNCYFNLGDTEVNKMVTKFNNSKQFGTLPAIKDAKEVLNNLYQDGYKIFVISSCGDSKKVIDKRTNNLHTEIGDIFEDIICLPLGANKSEVLSKWKNTNLLWVDDFLQHCKDGDILGLDSRLFKTVYNHYMDYPMINNWLEADAIIRNKTLSE